ncbi:MAG: hypothetical protein PHI27_12580 [Eubacteriales bacterium]|nr:hypothetical protein [Eubacteriales bacterium]MDD3883058.1 hypothetical protein [Eubacteriales bacterium]MDD4513609.1 hypothetical protein [Eubacteriales bacterium]
MFRKRVFALVLAAMLALPAEPQIETGEKLLLLAEKLSLTPTAIFYLASLDTGRKPDEYAREVFLSLVKNARGVSGSIAKEGGEMKILLTSIPTKEGEKNARSVLRTFLENDNTVTHILKTEAPEGSPEAIRKRLAGEIISEEKTIEGLLIRLEGIEIFIGGNDGGTAYLCSR